MIARLLAMNCINMEHERILSRCNARQTFTECDLAAFVPL